MLQSKDLFISHDGAGYLYTVFPARKILGYPDEPVIGSNGSDTLASRHFKRSGETVDPMGHNAGFEDPCEVVRIKKAQVEAKMIVTKKYQTATPDYLARW